MGVLRSTNATPLEGLRDVSTGMSWLDLPLWRKLLLPGVFEKLGAPPKWPAPSLLSVDSMDVGSPHAMSYFLQCLGPAVSPSDQQFIRLK